MIQALSDRDLNLGRDREGKGESTPIPTEHPLYTESTGVYLGVQTHRQTHTPSKTLAFCNHRTEAIGEYDD